MALASVTCENSCLNGTAPITTTAVYQSVHTATPGTTGASEVSGGTYARQSETWGSPSAGAVANTGAITQNIPASTSVSYVGHWTAATAGTYYIGAALGSSITYTTAGTLTFAIGADTISVS
jgi:hypothetical protein